MVTLLAFIVLRSGGAYAASQLGKNSVGTKQLKKNSVTTARIRKQAITGAKVKDGTADRDPDQCLDAGGGAHGGYR